MGLRTVGFAETLSTESRRGLPLEYVVKALRGESMACLVPAASMSALESESSFNALCSSLLFAWPNVESPLPACRKKSGDDGSAQAQEGEA